MSVNSCDDNHVYDEINDDGDGEVGTNGMKEYKSGSVDPEWLAENLTEQPWHEIGNCSGALGATSNFDLMVDQLAAVLGERLKDLVTTKRLPTMSLFLNEHGSELCEELLTQLRDYICAIGNKYRKVHYHAFEHATHVTLSLNKLVSMMLKGEDVGGVTGDSDSDEDNTNKLGRRFSLQHIGNVPGRRVSLNSISSYCSDIVEEDRVQAATFGISNNALLRFALVFSGIIHDVDHQGVPNCSLVEEEDDLAIMHNDISVAEQHSLQLAFSILRQTKFNLLKKCIMPDKESCKEFRKFVINIVLITDISNPERMQIAQSKWKEAFEPSPPSDFSGNGNHGSIIEEGDFHASTSKDAIRASADEYCNKLEPKPGMGHRRSMYTGANSFRQLQSERLGLGLRKSLDFGGKVFDAYASTSEGEMKLRQHAVIDTFMNVADVAHTMQSFSTFVKWNKRLYKELLFAYHADRITWDPTIGWYNNQIGFYDAYIIPLAKKMQKCGVFGAKGDVFLYFALENKKRWALEGVDITEKLVLEVAKEVLQDSLSTMSTSLSDSDQGDE